MSRSSHGPSILYWRLLNFNFCQGETMEEHLHPKIPLKLLNGFLGKLIIISTFSSFWCQQLNSRHTFWSKVINLCSTIFVLLMLLLQFWIVVMSNVGKTYYVLIVMAWIEVGATAVQPLIAGIPQLVWNQTYNNVSLNPTISWTSVLYCRLTDLLSVSTNIELESKLMKTYSVHSVLAWIEVGATAVQPLHCR